MYPAGGQVRQFFSSLFSFLFLAYSTAFYLIPASILFLGCGALLRRISANQKAEEEPTGKKKKITYITGSKLLSNLGGTKETKELNDLIEIIQKAKPTEDEVQGPLNPAQKDAVDKALAKREKDMKAAEKEYKELFGMKDDSGKILPYPKKKADSERTRKMPDYYGKPKDEETKDEKPKDKNPKDKAPTTNLVTTQSPTTDLDSEIELEYV